MADVLYDSLVPRSSPSASRSRPDSESLLYLNHLAELSPDDLAAKEHQQLHQASHSLLISLQSLSKRSHRVVISSANRHKSLRKALPAFAAAVRDLRSGIPRLDGEALQFAATFSKSGDSTVLMRRKKALLLVRNVERVVDVLELPALLASAISSTPPNYSSALDLNSHIRRLHSLYPISPLITTVSSQTDQVTRKMTADLMVSLKAPSLKLAASLRTIGWLRRVTPDVVQEAWTGQSLSDRGIAFIFLLCRVTTLVTTLEALQPLRVLADDEKAKLSADGNTAHAWSGGQQTERYLKRYVEIFREQSFGIISMFKSLFPAAVMAPAARDAEQLQPIPAPIASFPLHLVDMLLLTLREYLPCVRDQATRDSIFTQVLYCAGSLGRLGGDFGLLLGTVCLDDRGGDAEWVEVVKRHRLLAGRLESVIGDYKGHGARDA